MARLSKLSPQQADPEVKPIFDRFLEERGNVPNMFRTVALRPEIMKTMMEHFQTIMKKGTVPPKLKEMIAVRVSHLNGCEY